MHTFKTMAFLFLACGNILFSSQAGAQAQSAHDETLIISGNFTLAPSETKSIPLKAIQKIKNLVIQAEGVNQDSMIEVMVNGEIKGTIYAPGKDPSYVVTIAEATRSVEFRHRSGGSMRIHQVIATVSGWSAPLPNPGGGFHGGYDEVVAAAQAAMAQVDHLKNYSTSNDIRDFLFPIKRKAGLVYVMATSHGHLSKDAILALTALMDQIDFARSHLGQLMQKDECFDASVELLTIRETISEWLD